VKPLDVGVNGPLKHWMREATADSQNFARLTAAEKRLKVATTLDECWWTLSSDVVANSFNRALLTIAEDISDCDEVE
jgi:hypothetical protein